MTSCQLPEEDREIWPQRCVAYETFSLLVPDNDLNLLELIKASTSIGFLVSSARLQLLKNYAM